MPRLESRSTGLERSVRRRQEADYTKVDVARRAGSVIALFAVNRYYLTPGASVKSALYGVMRYNDQPQANVPSLLLRRQHGRETIEDELAERYCLLL